MAAPSLSTATQRETLGHATASSPLPRAVSTATRRGTPRAAGSNVASSPDPATTVHCEVDGQATPSTPTLLQLIGSGPHTSTGEIARATPPPGSEGSNVTSRQAPATVFPTAVHCDTDGQAIPTIALDGSSLVRAGIPGAVGSNVTSDPSSSTAAQTRCCRTGDRDERHAGHRDTRHGCGRSPGRRRRTDDARHQEQSDGKSTEQRDPKAAKLHGGLASPVPFTRPQAAGPGSEGWS